MPATGFNIGRDLTLDIFSLSQGLLRFKIITQADFEPEYEELKSKALDGVNRFAYLPAGHKMKFEFDRGDATADNYFAQAEDDYFNGVPQDVISITETIQNPDTSISQFRYIGVALKLSKAGMFKGESIVTQTIDAMASRIQRIV